MPPLLTTLTTLASCFTISPLYQRRRPLFWMALTAIPAILLAHNIPWDFSLTSPLTLSLSILLTITITLHLTSSPPAFFRTTLTFLLFLTWASFRFHHTPHHHILHLQHSTPQTETLRIKFTTEPETTSTSPEHTAFHAEAHILALKKKNTWTPATGKIITRIYSEKTPSHSTPPSSLHYGDVITVTGFLEKVPTPTSHGQFDYAQWLKNKEINHLFTFHSIQAHLEENQGFWLRHWAYRLRSHMKKALAIGIPETSPASSLMSAMLFGYTDTIPPSIKHAFHVTGTLHLFAVSGQNIMVILGMLLLIMKSLGIIQWRWGWLTLPWILIFCLATGMESSASRAFLMALILLIGWLLHRPFNILNALGFAALITWIWNPRYIVDIGFQLSFLVVLGLVLGTLPLTRWLSRKYQIDPFIPPRLVPPWRRTLDHIWHFTCAMIAVSICAWISALPIILINFHLFSPVSILANILIVPLAGIIVILAATSVTIAFLTPTIPWLLNQLSALLLKLTLLIVSTLASLPGGYHHLRLGYLPELSPESLIILESKGTPTIILQSSSGQFHLFDTGNTFHWKFHTDSLRKKLGIDHFTSLWLTQFSKAHNDALFTAPDLHPLIPPTTSIYHTPLITQHEQSKLHTTLLASPKIPLRTHTTYHLSSKIHAELLYPNITEKTNKLPDIQDRSAVIKFTTPSGTILLASDISETIEKHLLKTRPHDLHADILIQGIHRRRKNLTLDWIKAINPTHIIRPSPTFTSDPAISHHFSQYSHQQKISLWFMNQTGSIIISPQNKKLHLTPFIPSALPTPSE